MTKRLFPLLAFALVLFYTSCEDDDPISGNEEEVITRVNWTLTPDDPANDAVTLSFVDTDGDGGNDPVLTVSGPLAGNATYTGAITFDNEDEAITPEIVEEDDEHQIFYVVTGGLDLILGYDDADGDGNPIGLATSVATGGASTGIIQVILRHEPMKGAAATISNPAAAGGDTDIEVTFNVSIQ